MRRRLLLASISALAFSTAHAEEPLFSSGISVPSFLASGTTGLNNQEYSVHLTSVFRTLVGTPTVNVAHTAHGKAINDKISIADSSVTVGGLNMDGAWTIDAIPDADHYQFTHTSNASSTVLSPTGDANITYSHFYEDGKLRFLCAFSHMSYDDPIKFPGIPGATHLHTFFGNTLTNYASTYQSLRQSGDGTCDGGPINRTAYWFPTLIDISINKARFPYSFQWYYIGARWHLVDYTSIICPAGTMPDGRAPACPTLAIKRLQRGQKAIFGFDMGTDDVPVTYKINLLDGIYKCSDSSGNDIPGAGTYRYLHHRTTPSLGLSSEALCPSSGRVSVRVGTPGCWNGDLDDASDHMSHFATAGEDGNGRPICPATHPYRHIEFTVLVDWTYSGGISSIANWYLASDRAGGADYEPGETWHWDMMFAWEDNVSNFWATNIMGMSPDPSGSPYVFSTAGGGGNNAEGWVGSKFLRNFNNGGLSISPFTDCSVALGTGYPECKLLDHGTIGVGITDTNIDIPPVDTGDRRPRSRMR